MSHAPDVDLLVDALQAQSRFGRLVRHLTENLYVEHSSDERDIERTLLWLSILKKDISINAIGLIDLFATEFDTNCRFQAYTLLSDFLENAIDTVVFALSKAQDPVALRASLLSDQASAGGKASGNKKKANAAIWKQPCLLYARQSRSGNPRIPTTSLARFAKKACNISVQYETVLSFLQDQERCGLLPKKEK